MNFVYGPSVAELEQDEAASRGERLTLWRSEREFALECGCDVDAIVDAVADADLADYLTQFVAATLIPDVDARILKLREITDRMIQNALELEQDQGDWDE